MAFLIKVYVLHIFGRIILLPYGATWCNGNVMGLILEVPTGILVRNCGDRDSNFREIPPSS
jgi:integral membrane sensor domain MASE1